MVRISLVKNDRKTQIIIEICDLFPSQNVCVCEGTSDILSPHCQKCGWVGGGGHFPPVPHQMTPMMMMINRYLLYYFYFYQFMQHCSKCPHMLGSLRGPHAIMAIRLTQNPPLSRHAPLSSTVLPVI